MAARAACLLDFHFGSVLLQELTSSFYLEPNAFTVHTAFSSDAWISSLAIWVVDPELAATL